MFSPSGSYRNFIRLNTGFPWTAETERQLSVVAELATKAAARG
jgi:DNA-binding transcriptional MocR family regulator